MSQALVKWQQNMLFQGEVSGHQVMLDSPPPFGKHAHPSPKELLLVAMAGCTAMDVVSLLKKHKQNFTGLEVKSDGVLVKNYPHVFESALIEYFVSGEVDISILNEAAHLSLSKYCSVNAMISKVVPIKWKTYLNGENVGSGEAQFQL